MKDLFDGYNRDSRPVFNKSKAVNVELDVAYSQLVDLVILQCYFYSLFCLTSTDGFKRVGILSIMKTHIAFNTVFFMRREVAWLKLQSLPPTDTLIALKGSQND